MRSRASRATTPVASASSGVDIELTNLGVIGGELTEVDQHLDDRFDIRRWFAAITLQELPNPGAGHQPVYKQSIERRQLERGITHDLDCNPSLAERQQRPERGVFDEPNEELYGTRAPDHRLDEEPIEARLGMCRLDPLEHPCCLSPDLVRIA